MKRISIILALFTVVATSAWYWTRSGATAGPYRPVGQGDVYVALGDSLAAGFVVSRPEDAYVARIAAALRREAPIVVRNFAVPGETSTSMLRLQLPQAVAYIKEQQAAGRRVSPITLDIGGNDGRAAERGSEAERQRIIAAVEANIAKALDELIAATTTATGQRTADIAIMTYYNPYPGDPTDRSSLAYWSAQLNAAITRAAQPRGVAVADVAGAFEGGKVYRYTYLASGDVHANSDGHELIAQRFWAALQYTPSK
ncbi:MAG: SGNH/GDSL hydrolase family protein [Chloroflexota bacterium]|nr:SGNH/GDSL hydrolase family protein [Chloroflexota bacterium]